MSDSDDPPIDPPDPKSETKQRRGKAKETTRQQDEIRIDVDPWKKGDIVSGFLLERRVGSGVTSSVYRARELKTGRIFALKIILTRCTETVTASRLGFCRIQPLSHPALINVYQMLPAGDYTAFKMEFVAGKRLVEVIRENRGDDRASLFEIASRLLRDIGGALRVIHNACLVHRDVKPENVMLDSKGQFRLIDYGLVGTYDPVSDPDARRNYIAGTYWYMAPESITSQIYPPACDVYSLGCIILELIADRSKLPVEQVGISLVQSIGDVRSFLPIDTPPDLADLLCDMLDPLPQNRPLAVRLIQAGGGSISEWESQHHRRPTHLHGRENEMATAERWVQGVVRGRATRLHISGDSGVGKSWFGAELQKRIRANPWFQLFDTAYRERADASLQAFNVLADAIARRYSREDRGQLKLKPRHALALRQAFPSLRAIIKEPIISPSDREGLEDFEDDSRNGSDDVIANQLELARSDALFSGVELVDRMGEYGPLFLIFDDVQWADRDSLNVLDKILSEAKCPIGIITIGRSRSDDFRKPADASIELRPLSDADAVELLLSIVSRAGYEWELPALKRLAALGEGNAYRLTQLAACVSCDGVSDWHERLLRGPVQVEEIWQSRVDQLSEKARRAIEFIAIAGGPVTVTDLAQVSQLMVDCDEAVRELVGLSLACDHSPEREVIDIVHIRVRSCIVQGMDRLRLRAIHSAWATYLMTCDDDAWRSARIAGHLTEAGQFDAAVPYILQAARDAEDRFAFTEAACWHLRASKQLTGDASAAHMLRAIHHFEDAGRSADAAATCRELLEHPSRLESLRPIALQHRLAKNLLRAGSIQQACETINQISSSVQASDAGSATEFGDTYSAFYRPLLTIDFTKSNALFSAYRRTVARQMHPEASLRSFIDMAILQCRNPGPRRRRLTKRLNQCSDVYNDGKRVASDPAALANVNCGLAFRHLLCCDWASAVSPAKQAVCEFQAAGESFRFDQAHSNLPLLWSYFWLGRIADLKRAASQIQNEVNDRSDEYLRRMLLMGLGSVIPIIDDDSRQSNASHRKFSQQFSGSRSAWWSIIDGLSPIMRFLYEGRSGHALRYLGRMDRGDHKRILRQVQLFRVMYRQFEATSHLRLALKHPVQRHASIQTVKAICVELDQERIPFAKTVSLFLQAQAFEIDGDKSSCLPKYRQAADEADSLDLVPIRLAAIDRISLVGGENQSSELKRFLVSEGVAAPEKFAKLYCGLS